MTASAYDDIAEWYDTWVAGSIGDDPYFAESDALMGDVAGQRICDLACGQGRVARYLAARGAQVVGIDASAKLLAIARRQEQDEPHGIAYLQADARNLDGVANHAFDGVLCHMALMDIAELAPTLYTVARILRPGGWFVFATFHPCFHTSRSGELQAPDGWVRTIGSYFVEGYWRSATRVGPPGKIGAYHWTLSSYLNTLIDAGLHVEQIREVQAGPETMARRPIWAEVPAILAVRCRKGPVGLAASEA